MLLHWARWPTTPRTTTATASERIHAVALLYPKLQKKYGNVVTYEQDPLAHVKTEFAFDVLEVAHNRYAPDSYHDFIGFQVAAPLLEQAFLETYGLDLKTVLANEDQVFEFLSARRQRTITESHTHRVEPEGERYRKGRSGNDQAEIPVQPIARQL